MKKQETDAAPGASLSERLLCLLFPARCLWCGGLTTGPSELFCAACRTQAPSRPVQRRYFLPGSGAAGFSILSPMPYLGGYRETIHRYKFQGEWGLSKPLARLMAQAVWENRLTFDAVVYVPLSRKGRMRRGYDQSRLLAKETAKILGVPLLDALEKTRETGAQHQLSKKEREKNIRGAYRARRTVQGRSVLLVDDIVTTGATMLECAQALYHAGAARVQGLCAADAELKLPERGEEGLL